MGGDHSATAESETSQDERPVKYVCISDLHLGEEDSILTRLSSDESTADPSAPSPVMIQLVECVKALLKNNCGIKPCLILNGDVLDLALAKTNVAAMVFERFIELICPNNEEALFEKIIVIPGNHDHHLWINDREAQYIQYMQTEAPVPGKELKEPWHSTYLFTQTAPIPPSTSYFLSNLIHRYQHLKGYVIETAYPNFGVYGETNKKCVVFTHGHYAEPTYYFMTKLGDMIFPLRKKPEEVWDIEEENFAWVDFVWSMFGQSGQIGQGIECIYEKLRDKTARKGLASSLADSLSKQIDSRWPDFIVKFVLTKVLDVVIEKLADTEKENSTTHLSAKVSECLAAYIGGPLNKQILRELKLCATTAISELTFIFGHTHKPYNNKALYNGFDKPVKVYNTGGWVVESVELDPIRGGAVAFVGEDLDTVLLRTYKEGASYTMELNEALDTGESHSQFYNCMAKRLEDDTDRWNCYLLKVEEEVKRRKLMLRREYDKTTQ
jgi:Calcineurin-like phosphoesterase